jgi:hypothetical protein
MKKLQFLQDELHKLIGQFKTESEKHKRLNRRLKYSLFGLTGCATLLSVAALEFTNLRVPFNLGVVLVSVGASIVSSIEGLRKPGELWILERNVFHALSDLKRELEYEVSGQTEPQLDAYFSRLQSILATSAEEWTGQVNQRKKVE